MRRVLLFLAASAIAAVAGVLPWKSRDAAQLLPVETLLVDVKDGYVQLAAADGLTGKGRDLPEAMADMAENAPGELFFGQVSRVIAGDGAVSLLPGAAVQALLRLNTTVYSIAGSATALAEAVPDQEAYWKALEQRGTLTTLLQFSADGKAPVRLTRGGTSG